MQPVQYQCSANSVDHIDPTGLLSATKANTSTDPHQQCNYPDPALQSTSQPFVNSEWEINFLARMIPELLKDHSRAETYSKAVGEDVVAATINLGQVLHSKHLANGLLAASIPSSNIKLNNVRIDPEEQLSSLHSQIALPPLPPILNSSLEKAVFTHQGSTHARAKFSDSYERLEFLGDAYLKQVSCQIAYDLFPTYSPGKLSLFSQNLTKNETLAEFSIAYKFDKRIKLSMDIFKTPKQQKKVLGDIFEAYTAAIVLSDPQNGYGILEEWLKKLWASRLLEFDLSSPANPTAKEELAQKIMGKGMKIEYREEVPPQLNEGSIIKWHTFGVYFTGRGWETEHLGTGRGLNMKEAGNRAAMKALLNPTTAKIESAKKDYDAKVKLEKELQSLAEEIKSQ